MQACNYDTIRDLLEAHEDLMCRHLTLLLRKHFTKTMAAYQRPSGMPTLLRVVLQLSQKDQKSLRDVIAVLLRQLDISWMDKDVSLTTDILGVIAIFVVNFPSEAFCKKRPETTSGTDSAESSKQGKLAKLIRGNLSVCSAASFAHHFFRTYDDDINKRKLS